MAKQRPTLGTFAQPTSQFVAPVQQQATPLNQQAIRDTLAFADQFSELSQSAVRLASMLKMKDNEEQLAEGEQLVNQSRTTYANLVKSGQIKPSENPWFAIGAQQASGTLEAANSIRELRQIIDRESAENPDFLKDTKNFDALLGDYSARKGSEFGTAKHLSESFFNNFNPAALRLQAENFEAVEAKRMETFILAADASVQLTLDDISPRSVDGRIDTLQKVFDEAVANSGGRGSEISQAYAASLVDVMATNPDKAAEAEMLLKSLKSGTGKLIDTSAAKGLLMKNRQKIAATREQITVREARTLLDKKDEMLRRYERGMYGEGPTAHKKLLDEFQEFSAKNVTISAGKTESELEYLSGVAKQIDRAKLKAEEDALKDMQRMDAEAVKQAKTDRENMAADLKIKIRDQILNGNVDPESGLQAFRQMLDNTDFGFTPEERLAQLKSAEEDFPKQQDRYETAVVLRQTAGNRENHVSMVIGGLQESLEQIGQPGQPRPVAPSKVRADLDERLRAMQLKPEQEKAFVRSAYIEARDATNRGLTAALIQAAPARIDTLDPSPNDTPEVRQYKEQARVYKYDALLGLDESYGQEDTLAFFKRVATESYTASQAVLGLNTEAVDLYNLYASPNSVFLQNNMGIGGKRLKRVFDAAGVAVRGSKMTLQDALTDALATEDLGTGSKIELWESLPNVTQNHEATFTANFRRIVSKLAITDPDAAQLVKALYSGEIVNAYNMTGNSTTGFNLGASISESMSTLQDRIIAVNGSFIANEFGADRYPAEHYAGLAKFYTGMDNAVFVPVDVTPQGNFRYALKVGGDIVQDRLFTTFDLVGPEAERRGVSGKEGIFERQYLINTGRGDQYVNYGSDFNSRNERRMKMLEVE